MCLLMQLYQSSLSDQELWNEIQQSSQFYAQQGLKQAVSGSEEKSFTL